MNLARIFAEQICAACGYKLDFKPWGDSDNKERPCPCCGIVFGYDDLNESTREKIYLTWRERWIEACDAYRARYLTIRCTRSRGPRGLKSKSFAAAPVNYVVSYRMSKTLFVEFRDQGFWAFDVVSGIFLKHLVDVAEPRITDQSEPWLVEAIGHWRFNATCGDYGLFLDDNWTAEQVQLVRELATAACELLSKRREILAEEMSSWSLLDGKGVFPRGHPSVTTESAIRLGRAIIQLLDGSLPEAPRGTWWFFGTEDDPRTLAKRQEAT